MKNTNESVHSPSCAPGLKVCPFCGGASDFIHDHQTLGVGVACSTCGAMVPVNHRARDMAAMAWNQRRGSPVSLAALGGAATRGLSTPRKRSASRRNLRRARERKTINRIKAGIEASYTRLQEARQAEQTEIEAISARSRSRWLELQPLILADPVLQQVWAELRNP